MDEKRANEHPLFDPSSHYGQMRACVRAEDKMRGYLHWLWVRAKRSTEPLPPAKELSREERSRFACYLAGIPGEVNALAVLQDGRLASGGEDGTVRVWDLLKNESRTLEGHRGAVRALAVLQDGRLASGSSDHTVRVWDLLKNDLTTIKKHKSHVTALAVLSDGRLAHGSADGTVGVWDLSANTCTLSTQHNKKVTALASLSNGRLVSGSDDGTVLVWDLSRNTFRSLEGYDSQVTALAVLPDGRLAIGRSSGTVRLWNPVCDNPRTIAEHQNQRVTALVALPNGLLASASGDNTVRVWNLTSMTSRIVGEHGPAFRVVDRWEVELTVVFPDGLPRSGGEHRDRNGLVLFLCRWDNGKYTLEGVGYGKLGDQSRSFREFKCRSFLLEPEVIERVKSALGGEKPLEDAVKAETLANNFEIARILSAAPEMEGIGQVYEHHFQFRIDCLPVSDRYNSFPPRKSSLKVLVVIKPSEEAEQQSELQEMEKQGNEVVAPCEETPPPDDTTR